jgi:hypothetical protein
MFGWFSSARRKSRSVSPSYASLPSDKDMAMLQDSLKTRILARAASKEQLRTSQRIIALMDSGVYHRAESKQVHYIVRRSF